MAKILWLNWSGGGNLPPSLGVARIAGERGHETVFAGRPEMVPRVKAAGFRAIELTSAYEQADLYPQGTPITRLACYLSSPAVEAQIQKLLREETYDFLAIDAMFPAALSAARGARCPTAVFVHSFVFRQLDLWRAMFATMNGMRENAGFASLPSVDDLWRAQSRIITTSLAALDAQPAPGWNMVRHVGPVLEDEKIATPAVLPWSETAPTPLVLVSFSTGFEQRNVAKVQNALDALARLPVHVVATTGGIVAPNELACPDNATVLNYAAHDPILRRAALAMTHGGHGTAMRALGHGVPMIVVPGLAFDQACIGRAVEEWGAGLALPGDADADAMFRAAQEVLSRPEYREQARVQSRKLAGVDGAANAVDQIEELLQKAPAA